MSRFILALLVMLTLVGCNSPRAGWYSVGSKLDMFRLGDELGEARLVLVGEYHDRRAHHDLQLRVIRELEARRVPLVIGLEMFDLESQPALDRWSRGELGLEEFTSLYRQNWTIDWAEYDRILLHARNQRIPLIGLNAPLDLVARVSRFGWESLQPADKSRLPAGVTPQIAEDYREFLLNAFVDHRQHADQFENFCAAQGVRNNSMVLLIKQALAQHPGATMVVLAGVGHAMRRGVADALGPELAARTRIVVPYDERMFATIDLQDVDFVVTE